MNELRRGVEKSRLWRCKIFAPSQFLDAKFTKRNSFLRNRRCYFQVLVHLIAAVSITVLCCGCGSKSPSPTSPTTPLIDTAWAYLGLNKVSVTSICLDATNPEIVYVGSRFDFETGTPGRLFKTINGGRTWDTLLVAQGALFLGIVEDPLNPKIVYAAPWGVVKSTDGGSTWAQEDNGIDAFPGETHVSCLVMDPFNSNTLYAGTSGTFGGHFYKTTDAGATWNRIGGDSLSGVVSIAMDGHNRNVIYAGDEVKGILWKSTDGGLTWNKTGLERIQGLLYALCIGPGGTVYSGSSWAPSGYLPPAPLFGILTSTDGGAQWRDANEGLPDSIGVQSVVVQKQSGNAFITVSTLYGMSGIYERVVGTATWTRIGLDTAIASRDYRGVLMISPDGGTLYFGGPGLFKLALK